jgi:hypothetical protein
MNIFDKIICIKNEKYEYSLTIGKKYEIKSINNPYYWITDDCNYLTYFTTSYFISELEQRKDKIEKIKRIINERR